MFLRLTTSAAALALSAGIAQADYSLTILHTNDFHARFEPLSKYDSTCRAEDNTDGECFGGTGRLLVGGKVDSLEGGREGQEPVPGAQRCGEGFEPRGGDLVQGLLVIRLEAECQ
mgnify:CR=1 FL=1